MKLTLSCKKATYLISLKEERKLSFAQRIQLRAHLTVCGMCTLFEKQTAFISRNARHADEHASSSLRKEVKEKMDKVINEIMSRQ
jgi:hypothetical protein